MADIPDLDTFKEQIVISLGDLGAKLLDPAIEFAAEQALDETGWSFPLTAGTKKFWAIQRGKRHAIDILCTTSAYKFKYKLISLNQRFDHLKAMLDQMDEAWKEALDTDPNLLSVGSTVSVSQMFGTYIGNGFIYDQMGRDVTRLLKDLGEDNDGYRTI